MQKRAVEQNKLRHTEERVEQKQLRNVEERNRAEKAEKCKGEK